MHWRKDIPKGGFTLLELLVVMGIMVVISTIMATSYFGAQRAASYTACATDVSNALTLARQRACMNGKITYVAFTNETDFIVVQPIGRMSTDVKTGRGGDFIDALKNTQVHYFYDGFTDLPENRILDNRTVLCNLYNFTISYANIVTKYLDSDLEADKLYKDQTASAVLLFDGNDKVDSQGNSTQSAAQTTYKNWKKRAVAGKTDKEGDRYGVAVSKMERIPKGFKATFDGGESQGSNRFIVFNPDGSVRKKTVIHIRESIKENSDKNQVKITIETSGMISITSMK